MEISMHKRFGNQIHPFDQGLRTFMILFHREMGKTPFPENIEFFNLPGLIEFGQFILSIQ